VRWCLCIVSLAYVFLYAYLIFYEVFYGEMHRSSRVLHTPIIGKIKKRFKKSNFFETKDEYRYCTYKNISLGNYFYFILGKKTKSKRPMTKYYSLYIHHNFVFWPRLQ
jgi:hypothetical protein